VSLAACAVKPVVADDAVLIGIRSGELYGMTGARDRERVAMVALRVRRSFAIDPAKIPSALKLS